MSNQENINIIILLFFIILGYIFIIKYQPTKFRKND